jgi:hypothetical protein
MAVTPWWRSRASAVAPTARNPPSGSRQALRSGRIQPGKMPKISQKDQKSRDLCDF